MFEKFFLLNLPKYPKSWNEIPNFQCNTFTRGIHKLFIIIVFWTCSECWKSWIYGIDEGWHTEIKSTGIIWIIKFCCDTLKILRQK